MKSKQKNIAAYWNPDDVSLNQFLESGDLFDFNNYDSICRFVGTHPLVMQGRILTMNWQVVLDEKIKKIKWKYRLLAFVEKLIGRSIFVFSNHHIVETE